jgi:hypothetical protein
MIAFDVNRIASIAQILAVFVFPVLFFLGRIVWKKVTAELSPNHGSSLRDAVDRIEKAVIEIIQEQKKNKKAIKRVTKDLETHLNDLEYE